MANITAACAICGKVFTRPCKPRADGRYLCSLACAGAWRKLHPICTGKRRNRAWEDVRVRITAIIPVYPAMRPRMGEVYDAEKYEYVSSTPGYVVRVAGPVQGLCRQAHRLPYRLHQIHSVSPRGGQIQTGAFQRRGEICDDAGLHADAAGRKPRKT